jgi:hypothetical protein
LKNTEENCEMIWKIWMKCEMIWQIGKKGKLKSEKIWKIWRSSIRRTLYRILCYYLLKMLYENNIRNNKTDIKKTKRVIFENGKKNEKI